MSETGIILGNKILDVTFIAWFTAQFYKVLTSIFVQKKLDIKRFFDTGGMPSSHSSTVSCLATGTAIIHGMGSTEFAIAVVLAGIVMYDAMGIRRAAGKQAGVLNRMMDKLSDKIGEMFHDEKLKELLGHTQLEVLAGMLLGIGTAFLFKSYLIS